MCWTAHSWVMLTLAILLFEQTDGNETLSFKYGFSLPHRDMCNKKGLGLRLLILIASPLNNGAQRDAIRFTWGHYARSHHITVAFILGAPDTPNLKELAVEDAFYGDLIIGNSPDTYPVFKMVSMLDWTRTYCSKVRYLFMTNDRVFVNVNLLLDFVERPQNANKKLTVWGDFVMSKNDVRCSHVYLLTTDTINTLLITATRATSKDEVIARADQGRGLTRTNVPNFVNSVQHSCDVNINIACFIVFYNQQYDLWKRVNTDEPNDNKSLLGSKDVSIVLKSSKSPNRLKPVINIGILLFSMFFYVFFDFFTYEYSLSVS